MNYLKQVITVTRWEFSRFFKPKNEIKGIFIMLIVSVAFYFGSKYAFSEKLPEIEISVLNDNDGKLTKILKTGFEVNQIQTEEKESFIEKINTNNDLVLVEKKENSIELYAYKNNSDIKKLKTYFDVYSQQIKMQKLDLKPEQLSSLLALASVEEIYVIEDNSGKRVILAYFFAGLMVMAVFLCFSYQFIAITGEKQLKITEQIVSAISPQIWMDGKILGITLTGFSSMITYSVLSIIGGIVFFQFSGMPISTIQDYLYLPSIALYFPFALIGVLIWNALLAAVASIITDPNNSGKSPMMLLPVLFVIMSFLVVRDPDSGFSVFLSWFPLTSATAMPMRWAITEVSFFEIIGAFVLLALTFYALRKLAAKIFRVSILMTGKEPSWKEVYQFLKMK